MTGPGKGEAKIMGLRIKIYLGIFVGVVALGTLGFMTIEGAGLEDSFYYTIVTVSTVGYGDVVPRTQAGKLLAVFLIVTGVGTFIGVIANATETVLEKRERDMRLKKLNMLIGVFFSETGLFLLASLAAADPELEHVRSALTVKDEWTEKDFNAVAALLKGRGYTLDAAKADLEGLRAFLLGKRDFLVRLLENPTLHEHESFTELLRAVFHLAEEFSYRPDLSRTPPSDVTHLAGDAKRVYGLLVAQWLDYMRFLKGHYPYLFSLALRTNPFDKNASPIVRQ